VYLRYCHIYNNGVVGLVAVADGVKYSLEEDGLRIHYIEPSDRGIYECRAEVVNQGNLKVQTISVDVLCKSLID